MINGFPSTASKSSRLLSRTRSEQASGRAEVHSEHRKTANTAARSCSIASDVTASTLKKRASKSEGESNSVCITYAVLRKENYAKPVLSDCVYSMVHSQTVLAVTFHEKRSPQRQTRNTVKQTKLGVD